MMRPFILRVLVLCIPLLAAGCATSGTYRFYTLTPLHVEESTARDGTGGTIRVMPVEVPDYLERPQIVTRQGRNGLKIAEFDRWAGSLSDNVTGVLAENLGLLLRSEKVFAHPGTDGKKPDLYVGMQILRLEAEPGNQVILRARWTVSGAEGKETAATRVASFTERLNGAGYDAVADGISRTLEQVSREIARDLAGMKTCECEVARDPGR